MLDIKDTPSKAVAPVSEHQTVQIADLDLAFQNFRMDDPTPTGRQIVETFSGESPDEMVVLQWLPNGSMAVIGLDQTIDLSAVRTARFLVTRSDRLYILEITDKRLEWPIRMINGTTLKKLGGVDPSLFDVFLERRNEADREIDDDEMVNLAEPGVERFTLKPREKRVTIMVNTKKVLIEKGERTGLEIKEAAIASGVEIKLDFLLSLDEPDGHSETIGDTDKVKIHKGEEFTAVADDDNS